jgi:hypothetical protein
MHQSENELPRVVCKRMPLSLSSTAQLTESSTESHLQKVGICAAAIIIARPFINPILPVSGTSQMSLASLSRPQRGFSLSHRNQITNRNQTTKLPLLSVLYRSGWLTTSVTVLLAWVPSSYIGNDLVQVLKFIEKIIFFVAVLVSNETAMPVID